MSDASKAKERQTFGWISSTCTMKAAILSFLGCVTKTHQWGGRIHSGVWQHSQLEVV